MSTEKGEVLHVPSSSGSSILSSPARPLGRGNGTQKAERDSEFWIPFPSLTLGRERQRTFPAVSPRLLKIVVPVAMLLVLVLAWDAYVRIYAVPHYILPSPGRVTQALITDWPVLSAALLVTLKITLLALGLALIGGAGLAILLSQSRWAELALYPYAVILQVTPVVAIAPLILIYTPTTQTALLICAFLVAFFPVLSNTTLGLKSTDRGLLALFRLYGAGRMQTLWLLKIPAALPYFAAGLQVAGGLSLIAAVVSEFAAGTAGASSGLAFRILESQYRLNIPRLFAALLLLSASGVVIYAITSLVSHLLLRRWHESALKSDA